MYCTVALEVAPHSSGRHVSLQWFSRITPLAVPPHSSSCHASLQSRMLTTLYHLVSALGKMKLPLVSLRVAVSCYCLNFHTQERIQKLTTRLEWPYFPEHAARQTYLTLMESEIIRQASGLVPRCHLCNLSACVSMSQCVCKAIDPCVFGCLLHNNISYI